MIRLVRSARTSRPTDHHDHDHFDADHRNLPWLLLRSSRYLGGAPPPRPHAFVLGVRHAPLRRDHLPLGVWTRMRSELAPCAKGGVSASGAGMPDGCTAPASPNGSRARRPTGGYGPNANWLFSVGLDSDAAERQDRVEHELASSLIPKPTLAQSPKRSVVNLSHQSWGPY